MTVQNVHGNFGGMKKRLVIEVSDRFHADIKKRAAFANVTMKSYMLQVLIDHLRSVHESDIVQHIGASKLPK